MKRPQPWINVQVELPKEGVVVETKVDDWKGVRNMQSLYLRCEEWYSEGGILEPERPTHFRYIE